MEKVTVEVITKTAKNGRETTYIVLHMPNGYRKVVFLDAAEQALCK